MMPLLLTSLAQVDVKRVTIVTLSVGVVLLYAYIHGQNIQLAEARLVYANPRTVTKIVRHREVGPVRIVTRIVERPSGEKETVIQEDRGAVTESETNATASTPVPISTALAQPRTDRYLLTLGVNRLTLDADGKALFVGYGFKNRLDVQIGGVEHDGFSPWVLATIRF